MHLLRTISLRLCGFPVRVCLTKPVLCLPYMLLRAKQTAANSVMILSNGNAPSHFFIYQFDANQPSFRFCPVLTISSLCRFPISRYTAVCLCGALLHRRFSFFAFLPTDVSVCLVLSSLVHLYITIPITICQHHFNIKYKIFLHSKRPPFKDGLSYQNTPHSRNIAAAPVTSPTHCFADSFSFQKISPAAEVSSMPAPFTTG